MRIPSAAERRPRSRVGDGLPQRRGNPTRSSLFTRVCFFDQNPLSLAQLRPLLPPSEFAVVSQNEIRPPDRASAEAPLILVMDEKQLRPEHQPFLQMLRTRFSAREVEILLQLTEGLSNKEIAAKLHITESTVKFHLVKIFDKLGVHDRHSAAEMANSWSTLEPYLVAA